MFHLCWSNELPIKLASNLSLDSVCHGFSSMGEIVIGKAYRYGSEYTADSLLVQAMN